MDNLNFNIEKYLHGNTKSAKDYLLLVRNNLLKVIIISIFVASLVAVYAYLQVDIYTSRSTVKITEPNQNVLATGSGQRPDIDRFIANEIQIIQNYNTRKNIAQALIDSFTISNNKDLLHLISAGEDQNSSSHKSLEHITGILGGVVSAEQVTGVDVINITAQSTSAFEAALIANVAALEYQKVNLAISRDKLTKVREFLEKQSEEKLAELKMAEDSLTKFQERDGIIAIDVQSAGMLTELSNLDAQKQTTKMELMTSNEVLKQYKFFLNKQDPKLVDFLENETSQAYISVLQQQLAELQVERDLILSVKTPNVDVSNKVKDYDQRIEDLKNKLNSAISSIKAEGFSGNPEQVRELARRTIDEEIRNSTLSVRLEQLEAATANYEQQLKRLPKTSTTLSQYQRERESIQQLYLLINDRYQEAMINELSQSGNVVIIDTARVPGAPSKPNRRLMIIFGIFLGVAVSFGFIIIKDFFDNTVKTPEDIEKNDISFLSWVPHCKLNGKTSEYEKELLTLYEQNAPVSESFRAIRARIQHSRGENELPKVILVTSAAEHEGKTFIAFNLAGSFAQSNKRTLIVDCDFRRPRIHAIMGTDKKPGLVDYLAKKVKLEDIVRSIRPNTLSYIASGTIPPNPAEILESQAMKNFLLEIRDFFDVIILDSAPIVAVIDAEILAKQADGTVLVVESEKTENRLMKDAVDLITNNKVPFLGTVLNNFKYKSGYGYYYKYYYHYNNSPDKKGIKRFKINS
ncbi:MAG: polysaccharide biosynthesis tyrosine autokinase [Ignavibacterium sp.]|nr:polysaccharide biosynthesis tyrosine autokinase [Ignavibacterium sp.]